MKTRGFQSGSVRVCSYSVSSSITSESWAPTSRGGGQLAVAEGQVGVEAGTAIDFQSTRQEGEDDRQTFTGAFRIQEEFRVIKNPNHLV